MSWRKYKNKIALFAGVVLAIWLAVLGLTVAVFFCGTEATSAKWGQFGDAFGVANALFSGLALLGVIAALLMQREDIDLQVQEMRESVKAQKSAAEMQEKQARITALAEMLRAAHVMVEYWKQHESQPSTIQIKGEGKRPLTKKQIHEQQIPSLVDQLNTELESLVGGQSK